MPARRPGARLSATRPPVGLRARLSASAPACRPELVLEDWEPFRDVVHGWDERDKVVKPCPTCERPVDPQAWQWGDD
ncbi:hypothetical protein [Actinomadura geliboluensis]|uniref:hypothetical protein n=1 Tax=Actinomadura geliboluensis TaxID=882440 RepID=UPI00371D1521